MIIRKTSLHFLRRCYWLVCMIFLVSCGLLSSQRTPTDQPGATLEQTSERTTLAPAAVNPQGILEACPIEEQESAMRVASLPNWDSLGIAVCYDLQVDLQPDQGAYTGSGRIVYQNRTATRLPDIVLRTYPNANEIYSGQLEVTAATVNGIAVEPEIFLEDRTAVRIPLEEPLLADSLSVLEIEFSGQAARNFNGQANVYGVFNFDSRENVLTLANWYPLVAPWVEGSWEVEPVVGVGDAVVSETALYRVQVIAPEDWKVAATGVKLEEARQGETTLHRFASGPVRDFTLVASPHFETQEIDVDGVLVRHWGLPGGEDSWTAGLEVSQDSLALFDERFGRYPYAELDVIAVPLNLASGVEYPGLILIDQKLYTFGSARPGFFEIVISHEVGHQWWYAVVGNDVLAHPWQDEGLTTFSSLLYQEAYQPSAYRGTLDFYQDRLAELEGTRIESEVGQPVEAFEANPNAYSPVVYIKGALFFVELRRQIGDEAFFAALRSYYSDQMYNLAEPGALLEAFETSCSCDLDETYQEWGVE